MIRVVFLDIDDTLLSFSGYVKDAMKKGFLEFGIGEYTEDSYKIFEEINNGLWRKIETGELTIDGLRKIRWNLIFEKLGVSYDGEEFDNWFRKYLFTSAILMPHAHEVVEYLAGKYCVCAASNGPFDQQMNRLRLAGMFDLFDFIFISSEIGAQKPSKDFFDVCFKRLKEYGIHDLLPSEAVIIGDSLSSDMAGGIGYGMKTCFYTRGGEAKCARKDIDYIIDDLIELKEIL